MLKVLEIEVVLRRLNREGQSHQQHALVPLAVFPHSVFLTCQPNRPDHLARAPTRS